MFAYELSRHKTIIIFHVFLCLSVRVSHFTIPKLIIPLVSQKFKASRRKVIKILYGVKVHGVDVSVSDTRFKSVQDEQFAMTFEGAYLGLLPSWINVFPQTLVDVLEGLPFVIFFPLLTRVAIRLRIFFPSRYNPHELCASHVFRFPSLTLSEKRKSLLNWRNSLFMRLIAIVNVFLITTDHCNSLLFGKTREKMKMFHVVQNIAAWLVLQ